jgi:putative nucleotidyltransferase with HDIG domain
MADYPGLAQAEELFKKYNKSDALFRHARQVSYVLRHFAEMFGEDAEKWAVIGLLHDIDYEMYPDRHCEMAAEILKNEGLSDEIIHAVVSHGYGACYHVAPESYMEKVLFTIDELSGLIYATALMRPSKSTMDLESKSVIKKYKTATFAAGVDRSLIEKGLALIDKDLAWTITECIAGMRKMEEDEKSA